MAISRAALGKALRRKRGKRFSQEQIAEAVGLSPTQISKIECGHSSIYMDKLGAWCDYLGVSVTEIVSGADTARGGERFAKLTDGCSPELIESLLEICAGIVEAVKTESLKREEE